MSTLEEKFLATLKRYNAVRQAIKVAWQASAEGSAQQRDYRELYNYLGDTTGVRLGGIKEALVQGHTDGQEAQLEGVDADLTTAEEKLNRLASGPVRRSDVDFNGTPVVFDPPPLPPVEETHPIPVYRNVTPPPIEEREMQAPPGTRQTPPPKKERKERKPGRIRSLATAIHNSDRRSNQ